MLLPDNFPQTISHYLDGPNAIYHYFKQQRRKDGSGTYGIVGTVRGLRHLCNILSRFDEYDHYLSTYSYLKTIPSKNYIGGEQVDIETVQVNKIYFDIDPEEGHQDALYKLDELRRFPIPCRMYATGRGIQMFIDLTRNISISEADYIQRGLDARFNLGADKYVPISERRVFRIPYTRNSRNNRWCIPISEKLSANVIRNIQSFDTIWKSYFLIKRPVDPDSLLQYIPENIPKVEKKLLSSRLSTKSIKDYLVG